VWVSTHERGLAGHETAEVIPQGGRSRRRNENISATRRAAPGDGWGETTVVRSERRRLLLEWPGSGRGGRGMVAEMVVGGVIH
jgi:hypothetical protein